MYFTDRVQGPFGWFMHHLDRPINRFIMDLISQLLFLTFLLVSVAFQIEKDKKTGIQEGYNLTPITWVILLWACASLMRDLYSIGHMVYKKIMLYDRKRLIYDLVMDLLFILAIITKVHHIRLQILYKCNLHNTYIRI